MLFSVAKWNQHVDQLADQLAARVAEQLLRLSIHELDAPVLTDDHHRVRGRLEEARKVRIEAWRRPARFESQRALAANADLVGLRHGKPSPGCLVTRTPRAMRGAAYAKTCLGEHAHDPHATVRFLRGPLFPPG